MKVLIDDQLPLALARWIGQQGITSNHLKDVGLSGRVDDVIWQFAERAGAILISKDDDFLALHQREPDRVRLIYIGWGNTRKAALIERFGLVWPDIVAKLSAGERLVRLD
jgi:predicted nuclease of predicted toxin-antitoxin system